MFLKLKGSVDLLCYNDSSNELRIIEVKSYTLDKLNLADVLQASLYRTILEDLVKNIGISKIHCLNGTLMGLNRHLAINASLAYINNNHNVILINLSEDSADFTKLLYRYVGVSGEHIESLKRYVIIGSWCRFCSNNKCPYAIGVS